MVPMAEPTLVLRSGRDRSLGRRHPWIFAGSVDRLQGAAEPGDTVVVRSTDGTFLCRAAYNPASSIVARAWTFEERELVDETLVLGRLEAAVAARADLDLDERTDAQRWVFADSDRLPGLVVDRYGPAAVCQFHTPGADRWRQAIVAWLAARPGMEAVLDRSDPSTRRREGLGPSPGGCLAGDLPDGPLRVWEAVRPAHDARWWFTVDVAGGHKTGWYLDQRDSRQVVAAAARGRRVLDVFAYTGGFSVAAAWGGAADVTTVDSSVAALRLAATNLAANGLPPGRLVQADAFRDLRARRDAGERYDLVVLDPPKLAPREADVPRASRAYKDLNWLACRLLDRGGLLVTFSCSSAVSAELFQKIVFGAALDAGVDLQLVGRLGQPCDHPVLLSIPESEYLTGLVCRVV
jgi:23S rRNA (cytosine1962-C5)-methyltransferase